MSSMMMVEKSVTNRFFDRAHVQAVLKKKHLRVLSKAGAFIRTRARTKLRRRKRPSMPGQPPSVQSTNSFATLKNIQFALHRDDESVVVGPVFLRRLKRSSKRTVPELLEEGGVSEINMTRLGDQWLPGYLDSKSPKKKVLARYAPRPFMGPSLKEEAAAGTLGGLYLYG